MFMRRPSYLGEDSGGQAIVGESSQIVKQYWNNPKIVSQTVSHWLSESPNSLLLMQLKLEARVGIGRVSPSTSHSKSTIQIITVTLILKAFLYYVKDNSS